MRLLYAALIATTALTNSTTHAVLESTTIPAFSLEEGKVFELRGAVKATATNSTNTLQARVKIGPTTLTGTTVADSGAVDVADNDTMVFDLVLIPQDARGTTSGSIQVFGTASILGAGGTVTMRAIDVVVSSVDYTADLLVELTGLWGTANAGNSCRASGFVLKSIV